MQWPRLLTDALRAIAARTPRHWRFFGGTGAIVIASLAVFTAASAAITYVSASEAYDPDITDTLTVNRPTGVVAGDVLIAAVTMRDNNTIDVPAGWTSIVNSYLNSLTNPNLRVFYRVAGGSEPSTYTFTTTGNESMAVGVAAFRGIDTSNPIAASAVQANNTASTSGVAPSVTPGVANAMLVSVWATHDNGGDEPKLTVPASMTRVVGSTMMADNTAETRVTMARELLTAATATGTRTATLSSSYRTNTASIALRPAGYTVSGTVFEDANYGGGAGRSQASSSGAGVNGATVELYNSSGTYVSSTTTAGGGAYSFTGLAAGTYYVRVVSSTVGSQRGGSTASLRGVMTYRTTATSGSAVAVTGYVGGTNPAVVDPAAASSGADFDTTTFVYGAGLSGTAQAVAPVTVGSSNITGIDFGFNFDTVVNSNDSGQGSLRQAITNANTLTGDASLAQSGRTAAIENLVFMISNGTSAGGLRSAYDFFTTSAGSYNVATITAGSAFPTLSAPLVIDAQTQPGWTANPLLEINGNSLTTTLFRFSGGSSILRGFVINRLATNNNAAIRLDTAGGNTVQGNWLGPDASGSTATTSPRVQYQVEIYSGSNAIGGTTSSARNVIGNAQSNGIVVWSGSGNVIQGNYIGTNAAGTAAMGSRDSGIVLPGSSTATGTVIGGVNAGEGNVISGNAGVTATTGGIAIQGTSSTGTVIRGNRIGLNAAGSATIASGGYGIYTLSASTTIGGTAAGAGNTIAGHALDGVAVLGSSASGVSIQANSIYANSGIGIDLADNGVTANDGAKTASQPNLLMDAPVFTSASLSGSTLTVAGYVGSAAGQSTFASSRVEVFESDTSSGSGSGQTYLGALTADGSGNFSGSLSVSGLSAGDSITGTATDTSSNTSEFGANRVVASTYAVSGTVFEDINYGGGAGRDRATALAAGGSGRPNTRVELSTVSGTTVTVAAVATTDASGNYSFPGLAAGNYALRVVSNTVTSARTGYSAALLPVTTFRATGTSGSAVAVTNEVGGGAPAVTAYASTNANVGTSASTTLAYAEAVSYLTLGSANVGAMDFGFNFDTVTNTNDSGQGSLRQAITNANTLTGDASLAQSGRTAAIENLVFMISNGTAAAGLRSTNNAFVSGVATIAPASALPGLTTAMTINAQAQPGWSSAPIVEIDGTNAGASISGLSLTSHTGSTVRGLVIRNFTGSGVNVTGGGSHTLAGNYLGVNAAGTAAAPNASQGVNVYQSGSNLIGGTTASDRNVISGNGNNGIVVTGTGANGNLIRGNYVGTNAAGTAAIRNESLGIDLGASGNTVGGTAAGAGNLISGNRYTGLLLESGATGTTVQGNTIGLNAAGTAAVANGYLGVYVGSTGSTIGGSVAGAGNVISGNSGQGVLVEGASNTIAGNTVGLNAAGTAKVPNGSHGIHVNGVNNTSIGGTAAAARNIVSGNDGTGIYLAGTAASTTIQGNWVGLGGNGSTALGNGVHGIDVASTGTGTVIGGTAGGAGNVISGQAVQSGIVLRNAAVVQVLGNYIGTTSTGNAVAGNYAFGVIVDGGAHVVGDGSVAGRNIIGGSGSQGIHIVGGTGAQVQGNWIGIGANGSSVVANNGGVIVTGGSGHLIGGSTAGQGNVIAGNTGNGGLQINGPASGAVVQGNSFGLRPDGTTVVSSSGAGIYLFGSSGNPITSATIGGTGSGQGNRITGHAGAGVCVGCGGGNVVTGASIRGNSLWGSTGIGIDLLGNGVTANDGAKTTAQPNLLMDMPAFTSASISGGTLTIAGYVGSAAGQSSFAGATVDVYRSDGHATGYGSGQTWLGSLTTDANGNFSGALSVSGLASGDSITATATDASNNTSEFALNRTMGSSITGTVFEDVNYGGGAGRTLAASSGVGVNGATVELYNSSGMYVSSTTTAGGGVYSFASVASGTHYVRVVNSTVASQRSGTSAALRGVMTYRTTATSGTAVAVTDFVGGTNPALTDPGAGSSGATFNTGTGVFSAVLSGTAQSAAAVTVGSANITGIDFGFNFDTVVNTNDSGQGSLRQAITNANTLTGDASLAQSGRTAAIEHLIFMIGNGSSAAGLRSANNLFLTSAGAYNVATIAPTSALPIVTEALVIDAQAQPGWTLNPIVELNGASAGSNGGLRFNVTGNAVRGLVINRFTGDGINLAAGSNTVSGNWIGTNAAGTSASPNTVWGIEVNSSGNTIGGSTAVARNVISGNGDLGIYVRSGSSNVIQGNYIGTNAAGTAAVANVSHGVMVHSSTSINTIGGSSAGQGNLISGNGGIGVRLRSGSGANILRGNIIGLNATASAALPNALGIQIDAAGGNNQIGGTGGSDGNIIASNTGSGITISGTPAAAGNAILGNSIYANGAIGIDLGTAAGGSSGDGITVNTGAKASGQPNLLMNYPVLTAATLSGTTLTVAGYVGSAAGQSAFASSRVEVFVSDNTSANGSGQTYLGFVTADANGNFSGPVTVPGGVTLNAGTTRLTGTATDTGNNTSEFGPNFTYGLGISGTVFEDVNYGGGAGRSLGASGGVGVSGATVELYRASGAYVGATTTGSGGSYSFASLAAEGYVVRVMTSSVLSTRSGSTAGLWPVQTWRYESSVVGAGAVTDEVGGQQPGVADSGAALALTWASCASQGGTCAVSGTRLVRYGIDVRWFTRVVTGNVSCSNAVFGDPAVGEGAKTCQILTPHLHSASSVHLASAGASGVDFGYSFDTVVSISDSGQGSLRQAITNANTLGGDAALAQAGRTAGIENLIFMIPNGSGAAGLRGANNQFSGGVATITPASAFPIVSTTMAIDAQTQPGWSANPLVEVNGASAGSTVGFQLAAAGSSLRGFVVNRFATSGIYLTGGNATVQGCWVGTTASGTAAAGNTYAGIFITSSSNTVGGSTATTRNVVSGNGSGGGTYNAGILVTSGSGNVIQGNYVGLNAAGTAAVPNLPYGIDIGTGNNTIGGSAAGAGNVSSGHQYEGLIVRPGADGNVIQGNIFGGNAANTASIANARAGVSLSSNGNTLGGTAAGQGNVLRGNAQFGVYVYQNATGNAILGNSIFGNGGIGIDLIGSTGVNANDGVKSSGQPNLLMDSPVLTAARARGAQLTVTGYVGTAAGQSGFAGSRVELFVSDSSSGFGSGQTYLGAVTADGSGNFSGTFTMPLTALRAGSVLTATATDTANNTSEFGANFNGLVVDWLINHNGDGVDANPGDGLCETATAGQCTLRAAIAESNARAGADLAAFALPGCPGAGCVITPASALPAISEALTLDAQTQPGWTLAPIVDLRGTSAGNSHGLNLAAAGSTVRGLVIGGFGQGGDYSGVYVDANNVTIEGNHIGLAADGVTPRANGANGGFSGGVFVNSGTGVVIGGTSAAQRNVLSGNGGSGVWVWGGSATLYGNYIGTNALGTTAVSNGRWGVQLAGPGSQQVGGAAVGQGNVISGNVGFQTGGLLVDTFNTTIQGNTIGLNAARTAAVPNGDGSSTYAAGIDIRPGPTGLLIGGTNAGEGNVIAGNVGHGVRVTSQTTRILGNSIYGNTWLGIDLNADGVTANNGAASGSVPNNGMDHPVVTSAGYDGGTRVLTVAGYVGTGTGQALFAGSRIEFFASDGDGSGYGEGRDFLGTLTVDGNGRYGGSITVPAGVSFAVGAALTATATDIAGNSSEFGPNYAVTTMSALAPSRFNLFETGTASNAFSGVITTMTAGQSRTLAAIAIDSAGTGLAPSFNGSVSLQWMDARDNAGALDAGGCRASWVAAGSAGTASFVSGTPRMNIALTPAAVGREWRLRMSHTSGNGNVVTACSTDNFAVKPATIAVTALGSADSSTAGVGGAARSLNNGSATGGVVHRAGRPFALRAQAQDAASGLTAGYDGTAVIAITACVLPASGCTLGSLQHNGGAASLSAAAGLLASDTLSYSEVGAITVRLSDTSFADIDAADSTPAERLIQSGDITIGRFVPDRYTTSVTTAGVLDTVNAACTAAGSGYTFFGQAFGWATAPQFTVTALNAQGATTVNWAGSLQRLNPAGHVAQSMAVSGVASSLSQTHGNPTLIDLGGGSARLSVPATASFALGRDPAVPVASATPVFGWAAAIADTSEAAVTGNGSITGTATQSGIAFNSGAAFHTGRLALAPGHGDARRGVRLLAELQRYSAAGWVTMTEDRGCVTVSPMNVTVASPQGVFTSSGVCAAPVQAAVTLRGGRGWMSLPATPGRAPGRLMTGLNLGSASSGLACSAVGVSAAATPMNLTHLMGAWGGVATLTAEPRAALTWGRPNRDVVLTRERF